MSSPEWIDRVDWNELTTTLNNLDPDYEYELHKEYTIRRWLRIGGVRTRLPVADPIRTLMQLRNLVKVSVSIATRIVIDAVRYGYEEEG